MAEIQLGSLERSVLKSLQKSKLATAAEVAAMLPAAGTSEVDSASDALVRNHLVERVPGQHVGLQTGDRQDFYAALGFEEQPEFLSVVVGTWLDNDANR